MIEITQTFESNHRLSATEWEKVAPGVWELAGKVWHEEVLPTHFGTAAAGKYGYPQRSAEYLARKGHSEALVKTGNLKAALTRSAEIRVAKDHGGVTVQMRAPHAHFYRKELRAVAEVDEDLVAERVAERVFEELSALAPTRKKRV